MVIPPGGSPEIMNSVAAHILSQRHDLTDPAARADLVLKLREAEAAERIVTLEKAKRFGHELVTGDGAVLAGYEGDVPVYEAAENVNAAISVATDLVRDSAPYNVDGSGFIIGLWEAGGIPRASHNEFQGRLTQNDGGSTVSSHATHVAGTLIAAGLNPSVEGMSPHATILAHTSGSDITEMTAIAAAAPNVPGTIYVSNHSYGTLTGWATSPWRWYGDFSDDADPSNDFPNRFGRYTTVSSSWDGLAWNAPYYLIFKSAGNDRNDNHPSNGTIWRLNSSSGPQYTYDDTEHPIADFEFYVSSATNGYSTVGQKATAKNLMAVGSVLDAVSGGVRNTGLANLSSFSSAGPTDDGRIKPDIVANGSSLLSLDDDHDSDTTTTSGTSMSAPNACGSALLLQDYYDDRFPGQAMLASTLKGLMIHTADDRGNAGPDYRYGWGLLNIEACAALIKDHADTVNLGRMNEHELSGGTPSRTLPFIWSGIDPIRVTICWTDPPGTGTGAHDSRTPRLVHDLNLVLTGPDTVTNYLPYIMPWVGNWTDPNLLAAAVPGVNTVDNVEQVYIASPTMAGEYTITVNHAGSLSQGPQDYSLLVSGGDVPRGLYGFWAAQNYPGQWNLPAVGGFAADPEDDRNSNGLEYAFDLDPTKHDIPSGDIYTLGEETIGPDSFITIVYDRDTSKTDITYGVEWSTDLKIWNPLASAIIATNGTVETMKASLIKDDPAKYLRIVVTQISL